VADACRAHSQCVGFVMEDDKCGYIKASVAVTAQYRSQPETLYCLPSQPDCTGKIFEVNSIDIDIWLFPILLCEP
jgi:hypothetical protein